MPADNLIKMYNREKGSSERNNFNSVYQTCAEFCNPTADTLLGRQSKGNRNDTQRITDIGIKSRRMFTAGMMSHLFPQGQNWLRIVTKNRDLMEIDNVKRALTDATKRFMSAIENSNFYEEMGQCIDHCGYIGTTSLYCESNIDSIFNFRSHYIDKFYFCENYEGKVDTYMRDFMLTARQAYQKFGDNCPDVIKETYSDPRLSNKEYKFIHVVMPRAEYNEKRKLKNLTYQ